MTEGLKFFLATEWMKDKLNHFTPCACARGNYLLMYYTYICTCNELTHVLHISFTYTNSYLSDLGELKSIQTQIAEGGADEFAECCKVNS